MKDQLAFPKTTPDGDPLQKGLTKREYFAGLAMQGILARAAHGEFKFNDYCIDSKMIAECCLECADELLKQLSNPT